MKNYKRYQIFLWIDPYDGWRRWTYKGDGFDTLEEARAVYDEMLPIYGDEAMMLVEIKDTNDVEESGYD
jgi:hypothetical protein